jgi:hypothetical protein
MSGDGTYIEYVPNGEGPPVERPHPPVTQNPHDPIHYYQGVDGRYYYTPDGNPQEQYGQPPVKDAGSPEDLKNQIKPAEAPNPNWKHEARKGYKMVPEDLRTLASKLESELNGLKPILDKVGTKGRIGQDAVGSWGSAQEFTGVADNALTGFNQYYGELVRTYNAVISRLRTTANNGQKGEEDTHKAVTSTPTGSNGGHNKSMS